MNDQALKAALRSDAAWETLTGRQREVMRLYVEDPNVSKIARKLDVSRQAVMKSLAGARKKIMAFASAAKIF